MSQLDPTTTPKGGKNAFFVSLSNTGDGLDVGQVGIVPGADVAVLELDLPTGLRGQNREQVATRQLRDKIGIDPQTVEIWPLIESGQADKWTHVMVADSDAVAQWRETAGQKCLAVLPDYFTLPTTQDVWTLAPGEGAQNLAVRLGPFDGFGSGIELAIVLLRQALNESKSLPQKFLLLGAPIPQINDIAAEFDIEIVSDPHKIQARVLEHGELGFDLRRNPQLARARLRKKLLPWGWPLLFAAASAGIWAATQMIVINRIESDVKQLTQHTTAMVKEHFVQTGPILDARVQVTRELENARENANAQGQKSDSLDLFARAAAVITSEGAVTELVGYTPADGLSLAVSVVDFAAAERLAEQMRAEGMNVTIRNTRANDTDSGVRTTLDIVPVERGEQ